MLNVDIKFKPDLGKVANAYQSMKLGAMLQQALTKYAYAVERFSKKASPVDTGRMRASIATIEGVLRMQVGPHTNYAIYVHEGTRKMKARPFLLWGLIEASSSLKDEPYVSAISAGIRTKLESIK